MSEGSRSDCHAADSPEWPARCLESEQLFGQPHAKLFPLIGGLVGTAQGPGRLRSVFAERVDVALLSGPAGKVTFFRPAEVFPLAGHGPDEALAFVLAERQRSAPRLRGPYFFALRKGA